jgi:hypothetical protein
MRGLNQGGVTRSDGNEALPPGPRLLVMGLSPPNHHPRQEGGA